MTAAPAVAPAPAPVAPLPARAAPQPSADHFAFATVLDSLPRAAAKAGAPAAEEQARPSNESPQEQSSRGQAAHHSLPNDSALFASLPFALRAASMMEERPQAADNSPSVASAAVTGPKSDDSGGSIAAGASTSSVGRLIGERAFHFGSSTSEGALASRTLTTGAPFGAAEAISATPLAGAVPPVANAMAPAQIASPAPPSSNRPSLTRAASHEAAHSATKPEGSAPPPAARASESPRRRRQRDRTPRRSMIACPIRRHPQRLHQRRQVCLARSSRRLSVSAPRSNPTRQPQKPQAPTSRPQRPRSPLAPPPPLSRSRRSMSTFRREASRMFQ